MASRALARGGAVGRRLPPGLRHAARRGRPPGHPALAGHHVRPGPGRLLGQRRRRQGDRDLPLPDPVPTPAKVDGVKVSLLDADARDRRCGPAWLRCPDRSGCTPGTTSTTRSSSTATATHHSDALLGIFAAIYPAASTALQAYDAGDAGAGAGDPGLHPGAGPAHLQCAHALLQDRHRVPVLAERPAARLHHGRRAAVGPVDLPHLVQTFRLADRAGLLLDPGLAARRMATCCSRSTGVGGMTSMSDRPVRRLSLNTGHHQDWTLPAGGRRRPSGRASPAHRAVAGPGRRSRPGQARPGLIRDAGLRVSAAVPRRLPHRGRRRRAAGRRWPTTGPRSTRPRPSAPAS